MPLVTLTVDNATSSSTRLLTSPLYHTWPPCESFCTINATTTLSTMMHSLAKAAILWLPSVAFFTTVLYRLLALYPQSKLDRAYWKFPESPALSLWIPILLLQIYALLGCGKQLLKIKVTMFWSLLLTTLAIRCLTLLSALCSSEGYAGDTQMLFMFSTSPVKPFFLSILCDGLLWDYVNLGRYQQCPYDKVNFTLSEVACI